MNHSENEQPENRPRISASRILGLLAIAGLLIAGLWISQRLAAALRNSVTLPDGRTITLEEAHPGVVPFSTDNPLFASLRRLLPTGLGTWLPPVVSFTCGRFTNDLTVYLRLDDFSAASNSPWSRCAIEDDIGFQYPNSGGVCMTAATRGRSYYGIRLDAFPRRQAHFICRLFDPQSNEIATFTVRNPTKQSYPLWKPRPLPQIQSNGVVSLRLDSFDLQKTSIGSLLEPHWSVDTVDPQWRHAVPSYDELSDATGNVATSLSPMESAWKIRASVYRTSTEEFSEKEKMVIPRVQLPDDEHIVSMDSSRSLGGVTIQRLVIAPPGEMSVTNNTQYGFRPGKKENGSRDSRRSSTLQNGIPTVIESETIGNQFVMIEAEGLSPGDEIQLDYVVLGHPKQSASTRYDDRFSDGSKRQRLFLDLDWDAPATSIDLELRVSRPLKIDFLVNPKDAQVIVTNFPPLG